VEVVETRAEVREVAKGVHFRFFSKLEQEREPVQLTIEEYNPYRSLSDLPLLLPASLSAFKQAPKLYFFYKGTRLSRKLTTLELLEKQLQRGDKEAPVVVLAEETRVEAVPLERCLEFLGVSKIPVELAYYAEKVRERKIEYEREKQRKLSEVYLVGFHRT